MRSAGPSAKCRLGCLERPCARRVAIIRLTLEGMVACVRLYKELTFIFLLVALGVRQDGQKVLSAVKNMWGERTWILERGATGL